MGKRVNPMAVRANRSYDVDEAARALGVTTGTIRNFIKDGLIVMTSRKPYLMMGWAIRDYLRAKYARAKKPLAVDELFCTSCQVGRQPVDLMVSIASVGSATSNLKGVCRVCGSGCRRMISNAAIPDFTATFRISKRPDSEA